MTFIPKLLTKRASFPTTLTRPFSLPSNNIINNFQFREACPLSPTLPFFSSPYMHSTNNEDYLSELTILKRLHSLKGDKLNLLSICGGGDTITSLLNFPNMIRKIDAVDMNESQLHLLDLKIKAMITFADRQMTLKLLLANHTDVDRIGLYDLIRGHLNCQSRQFWDLRRNLDINHGVIGCSIYDRILKHMIYGLSVSDVRTVQSLGQGIEQSINTYLSAEALPSLFNFKMRPRAFVSVDRIAKNHRSLIENFYDIHKESVFSNYFFNLIMNLDFGNQKKLYFKLDVNGTEHGRYPLWLQSQTYNELRKKYKNSYFVDQILECHVGDVSEIGHKIAVNDGKYKYDYINLSNAMEWCDVDYYHHIIGVLSETMNTNGIIFHRFHLIKDDEIMRQQIVQWNKALNESGKFEVIGNNDAFKLEVLKNERSKFGFHCDCVSIAVRK